MIDDWIVPALLVIVAVILIGNFSTFQKNAKTPLRKRSLNDLKETLPRNKKTKHQIPTVNTDKLTNNKR